MARKNHHEVTTHLPHSQWIRESTYRIGLKSSHFCWVPALKRAQPQQASNEVTALLLGACSKERAPQQASTEVTALLLGAYPKESAATAD